MKGKFTHTGKVKRALCVGGHLINAGETTPVVEVAEASERWVRNKIRQRKLVFTPDYTNKVRGGSATPAPKVEEVVEPVVVEEPVVEEHVVIEPTPEPEPVVEEPVEEEAEEEVEEEDTSREDSIDALNKHTKKELSELAEDLGVEIPSGALKSEMVELLADSGVF